MSIDVHIFDRGHAFGHARGTIDLTARRAGEDMALRCGLTDVDVAIFPTDWGADQPEANAFTMGPHGVHVGIELAHLPRYDIQSAFYRLMIHELHHCFRWRHVPRWSVSEALALEGLALLADEAMAGPRANAMPAPVDPQAELAVLRKKGHKKMEKHRDWLYAPDAKGAPFRIYTLGRYVMERALRQLDLDPFEAATHSADRLVEASLILSKRISQ